MTGSRNSQRRSTGGAGTKEADKRKVQSMGALISQLISRRGYAQVAATSQFHGAIAAVVGEQLAGELTIGKLNRGTLKVFAKDSVIIQELTFQKRNIIRRIQKELPDSKVTDLRFAVLTE